MSKTLLDIRLNGMTTDFPGEAKLTLAAIAVFCLLAYFSPSRADTEDPTEWEDPPIPTGLTGPALDADGAYTVSWTSRSWNRTGSWTYQLQEKRDSGPWATVHNWIAPYKALTNRSSATYTYRARSCNSPSWCSGYSSPISITVETGPWPVPDSLENQLEYTYEARVGDIDLNNRQDIFVNRTSVAESGNGTLEQIILRQLSNGTFSTTVPTLSEIAAASGWPSANVDISVEDVNLDGFVDVFLKNIDNVISGALDQIVYAPGQVLVKTPKATKALDSILKKFLSEFGEWATNPTYFEDNAYWVQEPGHWEPVYECNLIYTWPQGWHRVCNGYWKWVEGAQYWSYDHFNQDAYELSLVLADMSVPVGSSNASILEELFERVFGTDLYGGILTSGGLAEWEIGIPVGGLDDSRAFTIGLSMFSVAQQVTAQGNSRPLTNGELLFAAATNGMVINDAPDVRVINKTFMFQFNKIVVIQGNMYVGTGGNNRLWRSDYTLTNDAILTGDTLMKALFLHELFHVYQYRNEGCRVLNGCFLNSGIITESDYDYSIVAGKSFEEYTSEERAEMVADRWLLSKGHPTRQSFNDNVTWEQLNSLIPFGL